MLASKRISVASVKSSTKLSGATMRIVPPKKARYADVPRPTATRALMYPQDGGQRSDPLQTIVGLVLNWLEPKQDGTSSMEEFLPDMDVIEEDEGHISWGHSHIADRLATETSMSQDFEL